MSQAARWCSLAGAGEKGRRWLYLRQAVQELVVAAKRCVKRKNISVLGQSVMSAGYLLLLSSVTYVAKTDKMGITRLYEAAPWLITIHAGSTRPFIVDTMTLDFGRQPPGLCFAVSPPAHLLPISLHVHVSLRARACSSKHHICPLRVIDTTRLEAGRAESSTFHLLRLFFLLFFCCCCLACLSA